MADAATRFFSQFNKSTAAVEPQKRKPDSSKKLSSSQPRSVSVSTISSSRKVVKKSSSSSDRRSSAVTQTQSLIAKLPLRVAPPKSITAPSSSPSPLGRDGQTPRSGSGRTLATARPAAVNTAATSTTTTTSSTSSTNQLKRKRDIDSPISRPSTPRTTSKPVGRSSRPLDKSSQVKRPAARTSDDVLKPPTPESLASTSPMRRSPYYSRLESSDSESDDDIPAKRCRSAEPAIVKDPSRKTMHPMSFKRTNPRTGEPWPELSFIHAAKIANSELKGWKRHPCLSDSSAETVAPLQYPGSVVMEKYELVRHTDNDEFDPLADMIETMKMVGSHLLPPSIGSQIYSSEEDSNTLVYRLKRTIKAGNIKEFYELRGEYNRWVFEYRQNKQIARHIQKLPNIPHDLVRHVLSQAYARTVAPEVERLREYKAFSSEVYGELLPKLTSKMFRSVNLNSSKTFVDLGSGIGNVVLHAALETGCTAWGCEKMDTPAELAQKQKREFEARCRLYGLNHGTITLMHDNFLENQETLNVLKTADVVLVNNFAFEPETNRRLLDIFLDLKDGGKVISLRPFVKVGEEINERNAGDPASRLRVEEKEFFSDEVSWTDNSGKYYVHTVDVRMLEEFHERKGRRRRG